MEIKNIRSDIIYKKMIDAPAEKKNDIYRYEMMKPFEKKWACYCIPLKAKQERQYVAGTDPGQYAAVEQSYWSSI